MGVYLFFSKHENFYLQGSASFFKWIKDYHNDMAAAAAVWIVDDNNDALGKMIFFKLYSFQIKGIHNERQRKECHIL